MYHLSTCEVISSLTVGDPTQASLDPNVFTLWLRGYDADEAACSIWRTVSVHDFQSSVPPLPIDEESVDKPEEDLMSRFSLKTALSSPIVSVDDCQPASIASDSKMIMDSPDVASVRRSSLRRKSFLATVLSGKEGFSEKKDEQSNVLKFGENQQLVSWAKFETEEELMLIRATIQDVCDQFRSFEILRTYFEQPNSFSHHILQISWELRKSLLEQFYEFDEIFIRNLLGKKITKIQKETEQLSEKLQLKYVSCHRQVENLKRISRIVEWEDDREREGKHSVLSNAHYIQQALQISDSLAQKYSRILFLAKYKAETWKKRLNNLTYQDFDEITACIMKHWSSYPEDELDTIFTDKLKDLKSEIGSNRPLIDRYRSFLEQYFNDNSSHKIRTDKLKLLHTKSGASLKALANISGSITRGKELRDFLSDLFDELVSQFHKLQVSEDELEAYLQAYLETSDQILQSCSDNLKNPQSTIMVWKRYLEGVIPVSRVMYRRFLQSRNHSLTWKRFTSRNNSENK